MMRIPRACAASNSASTEGACTVQNKAQGWIGEYEYRPDNPDGQRCVRVK